MERKRLFTEVDDNYVELELLSPPSTPFLSPPPQINPSPQSESTPAKRKRTNQFNRIIENLEEDEHLLGRVTVSHPCRTDYKLEQLFLVDKTPTPYVICSHPSCAKKAFKDRVSDF